MKNFKYTKTIKHKGMNFKKVNYGEWAIQATDYGILSSKHLTLLRQDLQKNFKKVEKFKFNLTLNKIRTKKPLDTRMGGGKGLLYDNQYFLKPGSILLEFRNVSLSLILFIFRLIINKISIKLRLININFN